MQNDAEGSFTRVKKMLLIKQRSQDEDVEGLRKEPFAFGDCPKPLVIDVLPPT